MYFFLMALEVGNIVEGTITGIAKFGAFVELPDKKVGLIHISEVANEYVSDVNDYLKVKDKVKVKVITIDERGKIALSIKQAQPASEKGEKKQDRFHHDHQGHRDFHEKMSSAAVKAIAPLNVVRKRERNPSILKGPSTAVRFPAVSVRLAGKHRLLLRISSVVS